MIIDPLEFIRDKIPVGPGRSVRAEVYEGGPPKVSGGVYGLDTETELITSRAYTPPLVLLQVCDGKLAELVPYERAPEYMSHFHGDYLFGVFNVGFDMSVLREAWPGYLDALDQDKVIDVGLRMNLLDIATRGYTNRGETLQSLASRKLRIEIEKGAERYTYTRDMTLSRDHIKYGAIDAAVTRWLMDAIPPQPTDFLQTRAAFALSEISRNGLLIDRPEFDKLRAKLQGELAVDAVKLRAFGFNPESSVTPKERKAEIDALIGCGGKALTGVKDVRALIGLVLEAISENSAGALSFEPPPPPELALAAVGAALRRWDEADGQSAVSLNNHKPRGQVDPRKQYWSVFDAFCDEKGYVELKAKKTLSSLLQAAKLLLERLAAGDSLEAAAKAFDDEHERTACWDDGRWAKPVAFLQGRLKNLEAVNKIELPKTEKTQQYETGKQLLTCLRVNSVSDPFFDVFIRYKHNEKLMSTYLKESDIGEDGRWHTRFYCILRTGRTSASSPNSQNLPRKDGIRRLVVAPPGQVLLAIDYCQLELCTLSQDCFTRFGHSRMREIINSGVDVHRWLGAKASGVLTAERDLRGSFTQEEAFALDEWLKTVVDKPLRNFAKIGDFGLPGGMIGPTFYQHCLNNGVETTLERAEWLRDEWLKAFPEMNDHLKRPRSVIEVDESNNAMGDKRLFESTTLTGRKRARCTRNASLNNVFQGLAADGAKIAMWNLYKAGARLSGFVHDEFIIEIPEDRMDLVPLYQEIMEASMAEVCPDVTIRTEATAMRRWDKAAKSEVDEDGLLSIYEEEEEE